MEIFINGKRVFELPDGEDVIIRAKDKGGKRKRCWLSRFFGGNVKAQDNNVFVSGNSGSSVVINGNQTVINGESVSYSDDAVNRVRIEVKGNVGDLNVIAGSVFVQGTAHDVFSQTGNITIEGNANKIDSQSGNIIIHGDCTGNIKTMSGDISVKERKKNSFPHYDSSL